MIKLKFALDGEKKDLFRSNEMILSKNERIDQRSENGLVGKQSFERSVFFQNNPPYIYYKKWKF